MLYKNKNGHLIGILDWQVTKEDIERKRRLDAYWIDKENKEKKGNVTQ
jgi:hypothetical protein